MSLKIVSEIFGMFWKIFNFNLSIEIIIIIIVSFNPVPSFCVYG